MAIRNQHFKTKSDKTFRTADGLLAFVRATDARVHRVIPRQTKILLVQSEKKFRGNKMSATVRPTVQPLLRKALAGAKILSADRERELLIRYHANEDKAAMDELVRSHMPIIFRAAGRSARNPGVDINDLVQTATEGLLIAINRWSFEKSDAHGASFARDLEGDAGQQTAPDNEDADELEGGQQNATLDSPRASRLATYAMWWMRIMLTDAVIGSRGAVVRAKNPKVRKALFGLPTAINTLGIRLPLTGSDITRLSAFLGVAEREIEEALVHAAGDVMLDDPVGDGSMLRGELFADENAEDEDGILTRLVSADRWSKVCEALMALPARDRFILITRYYIIPKWKLDRLSDVLTLSRERIRQIGVDGLASIQRTINSANTHHERRRPGRLENVSPMLIPLLRGAASTKDGVGSSGTRHDPAFSRATVSLEAFAEAIERAGASANPTVMAAFLRDQQIITGPTRVVVRQPDAERQNPVAYRQDTQTVIQSIQMPALVRGMNMLASPGRRTGMGITASVGVVTNKVSHVVAREVYLDF